MQSYDKFVYKKPGVCGWVARTHSPLTNCLGFDPWRWVWRSIKYHRPAVSPFEVPTNQRGLVSHLSSEGIPWSWIKKKNCLCDLEFHWYWFRKILIVNWSQKSWLVENFRLNEFFSLKTYLFWKLDFNLSNYFLVLKFSLVGVSQTKFKYRL